MTEEPGGYVVILFGGDGNDQCVLNKCVMSVKWFATDDEAEAYMAKAPDWSVPHCLPLMKGRAG